MAENNAPECPVCLVDYTEDGDNIPRILPCFHTACESCIKILIQINTLKCPECRTIHEAENEEKSFQQNKDVLSHIRSMKTYGEKRVSYGKCDDHGEDLDYCCFEGERRIPICVGCKHTTHKGHDFKSIQQIKELEKMDTLKKLKNFEMNMKVNIERLSNAKEYAVTRTEDRHSLLRAIESYIQEDTQGAKETFDKELSVMSLQLERLQEIRKSLNDGTYDEKDLEELIKNNTNFSGRRVFEFQVHKLDFNFDEFEKNVHTECIPIVLRDLVDGITNQLRPRLKGIGQDFCCPFYPLLRNVSQDQCIFFCKKQDEEMLSGNVTNFFLKKWYYYHFHL